MRTFRSELEQERWNHAKFSKANEHDEVLKNASKLKNTNHTISKQLPGSFRERQAFAMSEYKEKKKDSNVKATLSMGKLIINGRIQEKYLEPVLPDGAPIEENDDYDDNLVVTGKNITDGGSTFTGYASKVYSQQDVSTCLEQLLLLEFCSWVNASHFCL